MLDEPEWQQSEDDWSWLDQYAEKPDDATLSGKAVVAAVCAGLALGVMLAAVAW